jgi:hypothetical protein
MVIAGSSVWFVVSTLTMDEISDGALMAVALLAALAFISGFVGTPVAERLRSAGSREVGLAAVAGIITWFAPFMLVLSQRATDAPSGTETLFFTTAGWMLAGVAVAFAVRSERPSTVHLAGSLLGLLGSAVVLANWERPSSFSPFIKFPMQEVTILFAGVLFATGLLMTLRSSRLLGMRSTLWVGMATATAVAVPVGLLVGAGSLATYTRLWPQLLLLGVALSTLATGLVALTRSQGLARATSWLVLTPVALTTLWALERLTGAYGPNPIVWIGASGGAVLVVLGVVVSQAAPMPARDSRQATAPSATTPSRGRVRLVLALAVAAVVAAAAALVLPAFSASVAGTVESGAAFSANWVLIGAETAAGWLPLCVAVLALSIAFTLGRGGSVRGLVMAAVSGVIASATYPLVVATPLHTWNRWIPAEIQQAYGTEYARLSLDVIPHAVRYLAVGLSAVACVTLIVIMMLSRNVGGALQDSAPEESV